MNVSKAVEQIKFLLVEFVVVKMDMGSIQIKSVLIVWLLLEDLKLMGIVLLVQFHSFMMDKVVFVKLDIL